MSEYTSLTGSNSATYEKLKTGLKDLGSKVRSSSVAASKTLTEQVTIVGEKMKELFVTPTPADKYVDAATDTNLVGPDWARNISICDMINSDSLEAKDVVRGIRRRLTTHGVGPHVQILSLTLLETSAKNCVKIFGEMASERILDEMVKLVDDPDTDPVVTTKILVMIEAWGEAEEELRYLPIFQETYKSLKSRGVRFPGRDAESLAPIFTPPQTHPVLPTPAPLPALFQGTESPSEVLAVARNTSDLLSTILTSAPPKEAIKDELVPNLVSQLRASTISVQRIVQTAGSNESLLFEALSVNDQVVASLQKYEDILKEHGPQTERIPVAVPESPPLIPVSIAAHDEEGDEAETESLLRIRDTTGGLHRP